MTREKLISEFEEFVGEMFKTLKAKNNDYAGSTATDALANFKQTAHLNICSPLVGTLVRLSDKVCRLATFAKDGQFKVEDEKVRDTCMDLANYAFLFYALTHEQESK